MMSGDNNLLKTGLSLYSDKSSIMRVKYIGGNADKFTASELKIDMLGLFLKMMLNKKLNNLALIWIGKQ